MKLYKLVQNFSESSIVSKCTASARFEKALPDKLVFNFLAIKALEKYQFYRELSDNWLTRAHQ